MVAIDILKGDTGQEKAPDAPLAAGRLRRSSILFPVPDSALVPDLTQTGRGSIKFMIIRPSKTSTSVIVCLDEHEMIDLDIPELDEALDMGKPVCIYPFRVWQQWELNKQKVSDDIYQALEPAGWYKTMTSVAQQSHRAKYTVEAWLRLAVRAGIVTVQGGRYKLVATDHSWKPSREDLEASIEKVKQDIKIRPKKARALINKKKFNRYSLDD